MGYTFTIGSFNTNFLNYNTPVCPKIDCVASIILHEYFDVVALQEVCREEALAELCCKLPGNWKYDYSNPPSEKYGRGYVWNADRLRTVDLPSIRTDYHSGNGHIHLKREPYFARFTSDGLGGPLVEIRLINLHLEPSYRDISVMEYKTVAEEIYPKFSQYIYINDKYYIPPYTLSAGDYNLTLSNCKKIVDDNCFSTVQEFPTTISNKFDYYTFNDFDHFSYNKDDLEGFRISVERVDAVNKYFKGDFLLYRKCVSDHVPVKIMLTF